jgi:hypothetical protein
MKRYSGQITAFQLPWREMRPVVVIGSTPAFALLQRLLSCCSDKTGLLVAAVPEQT